MNTTLAARKSTKTQSEVPDRVPLTPEEWENRLIAKSFRAVEERIDNGTASAAEYVHFLKAGSAKQREEMEKLREENALLRAKTSAIEYEKDRNVSYREVLDALTSYRTETTDEPFDPVIYRVD
jgi:hypothetical protein